jgi:cysteine desulfurase / selenocysteine lyase
MHLNASSIRRDFPILASLSRGQPLVYLDNGATTQKPQAVIDAIVKYYESQNANIHRGVYELSQIATEAYESARRKVQTFINAREAAEIIFTRGTTEAVNLVASSFAKAFLSDGDEIIISALEHHSNIVPWQMACQSSGATLRVIPMNDAGELSLTAFAAMLSPRVKLVAVTHLSNSLGSIIPVQRITSMAHSVGAYTLIDGAQWVAHAPTDVQKINCDFYVFSSHKLFGPTGIGVLYGRRELLDAMPPYQGGGDMIEQVTFEKTTYAQLPNKFEAGTPDIAGAVGLSAAIDYVQAIGLEHIHAYERELHAYLSEKLSSINGLKMIGTAAEKASVCSFIIDGLSTHDIGVMLDLQGIAVRTGHHCCQPVMDRFKIPGTARASLAMYNTRDDVDALHAALEKIAATRRREPVLKTVAHDQQQDIRFPDPSAPSPRAAADELIEDFSLFDDWAEKHQVLIELGEKLLPMLPGMKTEQTKVQGCQSTVHLFARTRPGTADAIDFLADSDAALVRGLIAVLQRLFAGQSAKEILAFDVEDFFKRVGLDQHLSMGRRNGLAGMVARIQAHARQHHSVPKQTAEPIMNVDA